ncbi:cytochrome P450 [Serendipita vermifera]|nr:cytochrome P450 [Serendipita vermifera]
MEGEWGMGFMPPGAHHANQRKMLRRAIGPQRVGIHDSLIESEAVKLMPALNAFQGNPNDEFEPRIGHLISKATYGDRIWAEMGENLSHWNIVFTSLASEGLFGLWLVNIFHFLRFIPDWVPGLRFKQLAREGGDLSHKIRYAAYNMGVELHKSGELDHSILNDLLDEFGESADTQDATGVLYTSKLALAGTDTSTAGIIQFLHVLFLFPDVCEQVFEEIQGVTQGLRLPRIGDPAQLPYTDAVWKEAVRWRPFVPLVAAMRLSRAIVKLRRRGAYINSYFVPKGTLIHQNNIAMLNDPKIWEDPDAFRPERFLEPGSGQTLNPHTVHFGWGTRVCPGMYLADRLVFHMVVTIVSLYKLEPLEGSKRPDPKSIKYTDKLIQQPVGFRCRFVLRDEKARNLLKAISLGG